MSRRLVYVIGPSGAGKDSVLEALRLSWPEAAAHWARRTITRPAQAGGEAHEAVDPATFSLLRENGALAMHWAANGLNYGVRQAEIAPMHQRRWVFVNGSRAYLPRLLQQWPEATVVHIAASPEVLASRLAARGRETELDIAARLAREVALALPAGAISIENNHAITDAVNRLRQALGERAQGLASTE